MLLSINSCDNNMVKEEPTDNNPLLTEWNTPFSTPPFDKIKTEHYFPAFVKAIELHNKEINKITNNTDEPTFKNTIEALEYSGALLKRINRVFSAITGAMNNEELQKISKIIEPKLSKHNDDINLNTKLFIRVKKIYDT